MSKRDYRKDVPVPILRFTQDDGTPFPDWEQKRIGDVFTVTRGKVLPMSETSNYPEGDKVYPVYSSQTKQEGLAGYYGSFLFEDAITWTTDGANAGETRFRRGRFYCTNVCGVLLNSDGNANEFVAAYINSISRRYVSYVGNPKLMNNIMASIRMPFPEVEEQQKIATFLTAVDTKLTTLCRKRDLLAEYKGGVMQQLFSQQIRFTQDDGRPFPNWESVSLGKISSPVKRVAQQPNVPVMTISAGTGFMNQRERFSQVIAGSSLKKYTLIQRGEFAYNRGASKAFPYGCIYLMESYDEALIPFVYRTFRLTKGVPHFYAQYFLTGRLDRQLRRIISSSARMDGLLNINEKDFYRVVVPAPCQAEQQKIADFLTAVDQKITAVDDQISRMETFKKGLLQQMFV